MALVELGRFGFPEGEIIVGRLQSEGIDAVVFDAATHRFAALVPLRVMVDENDLAKAHAIIDPL